MRDVRIGLEYAITDNIMVGISRSITGRKFTERLSWQMAPVYLRRNRAVGNDEKNIFAINTGGSYKINELMSVRVDYAHPFSDYQTNDDFNDPLANGVDFYTGLHVFHVNFSNSTGIIPNIFLPYTSGSWLDGDIRFGFSITRWFYL